MLAVIVIYCTISLDVRLSLFILLEEKTYKIVSYNILSTIYRLDSVWSARINTMTEKRDKFGRRIYIFRLGSSSTVCIVL